MSRSMSSVIQTVAITTAFLLAPQSAAAEGQAEWGPYNVGFTEKRLNVTGSQGEARPLDLLMWYPADVKDYGSASPSYYRPRLYGLTLDPMIPPRWDPLSWQIAAEQARDDVSIDSTGPSFALLIFSPANAGDPFNYAFTSERLASHGYVVVGPFHNGDNQDDRRIDFINQQAGSRLLKCIDNLAPPCIEPMARSMTNRHRDIGKIIDSIGIYFRDRVDTSRVGVIGQSRGSMTALAEAGGSTTWSITPDPRVKAVMTLATGSTSNMASVGMENITVPTLMVVGTKDGLNHFSIAQASFARIPETTQKGLVIIAGAHHRVYGDTYCAQTQVVAAIAQSNPRAILEEDTMFNLYKFSPASGSPFDWCSYDTFVNPVDTIAYHAAFTGFTPTPTNVPRALESNEVMRLTTELATTFFGTTLDNHGEDGVHFTRYLATKWLLHHEGNIYDADFFAEDGDVCPPGQDVECD